MTKLFKNLTRKNTVKRHHLIVDELDVMRVITALDKYECHRNISLGNCGWADTAKWFIHFDMSNKKWSSFVKELQVIRVWENNEVPKNTIGKAYSTD